MSIFSTATPEQVELYERVSREMREGRARARAKAEKMAASGRRIETIARHTGLTLRASAAIFAEAERARLAPHVRTFVLARDGNRCRRCGSQERPCADHVKPVSRGGRSTTKNLQTLCGRCNSRKGARVA